MENNQIIDLKIYDLCKTKLKLGDGDATILSKSIQVMFEEERESLLKHYTEIERKDRKEFEQVLDQRVGCMVDLFEKKFAGVNHVDIMQWMFTYFAFVMGGIVAILLILLKK